MAASFVILGVIGGVVLVGLLAVILGIVALVRINRSGGALRGRGLAIAAIVIGALMLLAPVLGLSLLFVVKRAAPTSGAPYHSAPAEPPLVAPSGTPEE